MATKLLPPSIDGKLPAQIGDTLCIPYTHNRAVGANDYDKMSLLIKTISTGLEVATLKGDKEANFNLKNTQPLTIGQFYKAQLAYIDKEGVIGHYSTVGVFKYTDEPKLTLNTEDSFTYVEGLYQAPSTDPNEKLYSYQFDIYENILNSPLLIESSGELLHNASEKIDRYNYHYAFLDRDVIIKYTTKSINGLVQTTEEILLKSFDKSKENEYLYIQNDIDLGQNIIEVLEKGILSRNGEIIADLAANSTYIDSIIEQGIQYDYRLYVLENNQYEDISIATDYEDIFLSDASKQLSIKFNPKISSFKETIMESKVDTIGGQFPFFFRNGDTKYKEFPISGMISYHMNNNDLFMIDEDLGFKTEPSRNSTSDSEGYAFVKNTSLSMSNIKAERIFRNKVLEWLNNGEPKVFRSPTEGVFIIRLMNISLSPNDTVGRMLYTFNATAYEIDECNFANLKKYNLMKER